MRLAISFVKLALIKLALSILNVKDIGPSNNGCPDPSSNPYLAFAAMLMAGLDGIINKIEPPAPVDKDLYELTGEEAAEIAQVPGSLDEALNNLERDHEFLLKGGVFTKDLIDTWIDFKRKQEVDYVRLRPHPAEFELYFDL